MKLNKESRDRFLWNITLYVLKEKLEPKLLLKITLTWIESGKPIKQPLHTTDFSIVK